MESPDPSQIDLLIQFTQPNSKDVSFAPNFEHDFPPEYDEMMKCLRRGDKWTGPASAAMGFHFSPKVLDVVAPQAGELYFFPERPTVYQLKKIAEISQSASGWNGRRENKIRVPDVFSSVFCYAIAPDTETSKKQITVEPNADYFGLMGLKVVTNNALKWQVVDKKVVFPVSG